MAAADPPSGVALATAGLRVQQGRIRVMAENLANANSTARTPGGDPYRRKIAVFEPIGISAEPVGRVVQDTSGFRTVFDPGHPAADPLGNLKLPNVNPVAETADLQAATRAYEANLKVISTLGELEKKTVALLTS
jgi:flagellar basal-body rod protein FlgC